MLVDILDLLVVLEYHRGSKGMQNPMVGPLEVLLVLYLVNPCMVSEVPQQWIIWLAKSTR